jgi:hypothetical protein
MPPVISKFGTVVLERVSVYRANNIHSGLVRYLSKGDNVFVYEEDGGWGKINALKEEWIELSAVNFKDNTETISTLS